MTEPVVLDTSVLIKWLVAEERLSDRAQAVLTDLQQEKITVHAPALARYEVGNALLKGKKLTVKALKQTLLIFDALPIEYVSESRAVSALTIELADKLGITYYDAAFLAVATSLKATLVTDNLKHQRSVAGVSVVALAKYR